jgi:hypothetical protein
MAPYAVAGSGKGVLYVLNPKTGAVITKLTTTAGDPTTPSGLAKWGTGPTTRNSMPPHCTRTVGTCWATCGGSTSIPRTPPEVIKLATFGREQQYSTHHHAAEMTNVGLNHDLRPPANTSRFPI